MFCSSDPQNQLFEIITTAAGSWFCSSYQNDLIPCINAYNLFDALRQEHTPFLTAPHTRQILPVAHSSTTLTPLLVSERTRRPLSPAFNGQSAPTVLGKETRRGRCTPTNSACRFKALPSGNAQSKRVPATIQSAQAQSNAAGEIESRRVAESMVRIVTSSQCCACF